MLSCDADALKSECRPLKHHKYTASHCSSLTLVLLSNCANRGRLYCGSVCLASIDLGVCTVYMGSVEVKIALFNASPCCQQNHFGMVFDAACFFFFCFIWGRERGVPVADLFKTLAQYFVDAI